MSRGNVNKAKGTKWESATVNYLKAHNLKARRRPLNGSLDLGDIEIIDEQVVIQAKWTKATPTAGLLDSWFEATLKQATNVSLHDFVPFDELKPVLVHNRQGKASPEFAIWWLYNPFHNMWMRTDGDGFLRWLGYEQETI